MVNTLTLVFLGSMIVTSYRSVPEQTDDTPFLTSIGERTHKYGIAVSQDLLCPIAKQTEKDIRKFTLCKREANCPRPIRIHYGDYIYTKELGVKVVNDVMHERHRNRMDVWVSRLDEEQSFHKKFGKTKLKVYRIEVK